MQEKNLVTSVLHGTEMLRSMALRRINTFAFRVISAVSVAERSLIRYGKLPELKRIRSDEQQFVIGLLMLQVDYFSGPFSLQDAANLTSTLNDMRMRFNSDEKAGLHQALPQGEFADKNAALLEVYDRYMQWLTDNGRIDDIDIIRCAIEQCGTDAEERMNAEFLVLSEFPLSPLESALVNRLSGGNTTRVSLRELFGTEASQTENGDELRLDSVTKAYGAVNEVDQVIKNIYESGSALDRCVVAVSDASVYGQLFYDAAMEKGIPIAFGCGISVSNSGPAGLLGLWNQWNGTGFHGVDALQAMVFSDTFERDVLMDELNQGRTEEGGKVSVHRLTELAGSMRLESNPVINEQRISAWEKTLSESSEDLQWAGALHRFGRELGLPCDRFLKKYARIRQHSVGRSLDKSALSAILDILSLPSRFPGLVSMEEMIPASLGTTVCAESAQPGKLLVTTIPGALSVQRDHLYVLGLSADQFPGKPGENALMLDSDWALLPEADTAPTSVNRVKSTLECLMELDRLAASLGIDVHVYWPDYNPAKLKELIPSSVIYRLLDGVSNAEKVKVGYFPAVYSETYAAGKLYLDEGIIPPTVDVRDQPAFADVDLDMMEWAPTAIDTWFSCKRQFQYKYILKLDVAEPDDPMVVISKMEFGNLAHHLMEILAAERPDEEEFRDLASRMFDDYLTARPPMDPHAAETEKENFVRMMVDARRQDPGREAILSEEKLHGIHPCGLKLSGRPDRVERDEDGRYIVADFKTGRKVVQQENDPQSCRQALIYAWLLQQNGKPPATCEYRYLRSGQTVPCEVNPLTMSKLDEDFALFYNGLKSGDFAPEDGYGNRCEKSSCQYCPYRKICDADMRREGAQA